MQPLYATRLRIPGDGDQVDPVRRSVLADIATWAWRDDGSPPDLLAEDRGEAGSDGYRLSWRTIEVDDHPDAVSRVALTHADDEHAGIDWITSVDVVSTASEVRASLQIQRLASQMRIAPATLELHRPRLVPALIQHHQCDTGDDISLSPIERLLEPADISEFVARVLTLPHRALPVLVLSIPAGAEAPLADARYLADALAGLAHVYVLSGQLAWERLRDALGSRCLVPRSGARLFWPGLGAEGDSLRHPFWGPAALRHRSGRRPFGRYLFSILAPLSVLRVPADPAIPAIRRAYAMRSITEIAEQSAEEAVGTALEQIEEVDELRDEVDRLTSELEKKNEVILRHEQNWRDVHHHRQSDPQESGAECDTAPVTADSWEEAAELVEILTDSDAFVVTDNAKAQLSANLYPNPDRMFEHLERLAKAADDYRAADGDIGGRFDEWVHTGYGIEVSLHDAGLVEAGRDKFEFEGKTHSREPHVKVDDYKAPADCGRIYFALDRKRILVDHIGLHL